MIQMYYKDSYMLHLNDDDSVDSLNYLDYYHYSVLVLLTFAVVELLPASSSNDVDMHLLLRLPLPLQNVEMSMLICMRKLRMMMMVMWNLLY